MSVKAIAWAFELYIEDALAKLVLLALADYADNNGNCWPSVESISVKASCSRASVFNKLKELEAAKWLLRQKRRTDSSRQTSNYYTLNLDRKPDSRVYIVDSAPSPDSIDVDSAPRRSKLTKKLNVSKTKARVTSQKAESTCVDSDMNRQADSEPSKNIRGGLFDQPEVTKARGPAWPSDYQEQFWRLYPRRVEKKSAMAKLDALRKSGTVQFDELMAAVSRYSAAVSGTEIQYIKHPTTWLNKGCWDDDIAAIKSNRNTNRPSFIDLALGEPNGSTAHHTHR